MWLRKMGFALCWICLVLFSTATKADDTELFVYDFSKAGDYRPKVLIIFDNSSSMNDTMEIENPYDSSVKYPSLGRNDPGDNYIYYSTNANVPTVSQNNNNRFKSGVNTCASSITPLGTIGYFISDIWTYEYSDYSGGKPRQGHWESINGHIEDNIPLVECKQDVIDSNPSNPFSGSLVVGAVSAGYPIDKAARNSGSWYYTQSNTNFSLGVSGATLYTINYLRWYYGSKRFTDIARLRIAKDAIKSVVAATPGVDFGLAVFNRNNISKDSGDNINSSSGGRIIRRVLKNDTNSTNQTDLIGMVETLTATPISPNPTYTPLCETLYEAYNYYGGKAVKFGMQGGSLTPVRDQQAEKDGSYISPYDPCSNNGYVIYVTDGEPSNDTAVNAKAQALINTLSQTDKDKYGKSVSYGPSSIDNEKVSYLAALAGYMKNNDVNSTSLGDQTVTTFTIGFGDEAIKGAGNLLAETARRGGGQYYPATGAETLSQALRSSLLAILRINSSLVTPAIATNNFDRTSSLNNIYYAMFAPDNRPRWKGNLKKLMLSADGYVADVNGLPAISSDGAILEQAQTYWSAGRDGNAVAKGGVQAMLAQKSSRKIYVINPAVSPKRLDDFNKANLAAIAGSEANLASYMQLSATSELDAQINWTKGIDVDDEDLDGSTTSNRLYIVGDPLHSRPLAVNYGCTIASGQTSCVPDIRILMGANSGFLHMFKDLGNSVDESWALIPYELLPMQKALRLNAESGDHIYGIDSPPVALVKDVNRDGIIKSSDGDLVWLFFGLRAGGSSYYALDITRPDDPSMKWMINDQIAGFTQLGQTWSVPEVAYIPGVVDPVLIFGGGYDVNKNKVGIGVIGSADSKGAGVYIVNAHTGALIFSATPGGPTTVNKRVMEMVDSMPGAVAVLDSDGDGKTDRIYAGDTGGNIWRMDMPSINTSDWSIFKFASLGSDTIQADDRRFFTKPVLARTINRQVIKTTMNGQDTFSFKERPFDAVLIGTGDRNHPSSESTVKNTYVMLRDRRIVPRTFAGNIASCEQYSDAEDLTKLPCPITMDNLYDVTDDPFSGVTDTEQQLSLRADITGKPGWKFWLSKLGEKSMGSGVVLQGQLYFTSFIPTAQSFKQCIIQSIGVMRQYMFDMHYGSSFRYVVDQDGTKSPVRYLEVNNKVADDLVVHADADSNIRVIGGAPGEEVILKDNGQGQPARCTQSGQCSQGAEEVEMDMSPKKIYLYEGEVR